ncbi:hypothetical protein BGZ68_006286 [Mortierella alpina]|nr:hypothetical protein BGZ68_006286 [Mortierella alpina]
MFGSTFSGGGFGGQQQQNAGGFGSGQSTFGSGSFGAPATGFGAAANPGFGGAQQNPGFGAAPATNAFGAAPANTGFGGGGGFGGSTTGFGVQAQAQPQSGFGGSSFGAANTATSGGGFGGGFGSTAGAAPGFGSGSGFGAKPATTGFGAQPASGFGAAANTGFGGGAATSTFGAGGGMLGGGMNATAAGNGTVNPAFSAYLEKDPATGQNSHYQSITAMPAYRGYSFEELRLQDYQQGRKFPGQGAGFGGATGGFGQQQQPATTGFGAQPSTGFGASNTTSTLGGFGSGSTGFGAAATSGFGSSSAFGSAAPASTAFGAQAAAPASGFGATTSAFGAQPSTGFGQTTGATGFGAAGGFGATAAKPATGFGGFGATATSQPGFGAATTGGFGAPAAAPSMFGGAGGATTNAFGAPAASSAPGFGGFGATQTSAAPASTGLNFGLGGTGAFGAAKPATTSLFGNPATSAPAPAFGAFGTTPASGSGGLFGASSGSSLFPATSTAPTSLFGGGVTSAPAFGASTTSTGMFGANKPATSGGLFSQAPTSGFGATPGFGTAGATQQPSMFGGVGTTSTFGTSTLGGGFLGGSTNTAAAQPAMVASVNGNIYGDNPLFQRDNTAPTTKSQPAVLSRPEPAQKLPALIPPVRFSPRHSQIRLRPTSTATFSSSVAGSEAAPGRKSLLLLDGINDDSAFSSDDYTPRRSVKKLDLKPRGHSEDHAAHQPQGAQHSGVTFNPSFETAAADSVSRSRPMTQDRPPLSVNGTQFSQSLATSTRPETSSSGSAITKKPEGEYWMSPTLEELRKMSRSELQHVENFKVGLPEYGSVTFLQPVDLTGVASLSAICGHIVIFDKKTCSVYPDDNNKPPRGQGLNVPALISLEKCWPMDRSTRELVVFDKSSPMYAQHLKRLRRQADTTFIDFTTDNGTWTFRVEHFSEYGLGDEDDDEDHAGHQGQTAVPLPTAVSYQNQGITNPNAEVEMDDGYASRGPSAFSGPLSGSQGDRAHGASRSARHSDPQRVNMMRASLFGAEESHANNDRLPKRSGLWSSLSDYSEKAENPAEHADGFVAESLLSRKGTLLVDAGLMMGRSCRVGWGPNGQLALCGTLCGAESVEDRATHEKRKDSATTIQLMKVQVVAADEEQEIRRNIVSLQALLQYTTITLDKSDSPEATIVPNTSFTALMTSLKEREHNLSSEEVYAWILGQSLFDKQPAPDNISEMSKEAQESYEAIGRRVRCSNWLSHVTKPLLDADLRRIEDGGKPNAAGEMMFTLLASNKRQKACVAAVESGDVRLATLISQSGRGSMPLAGVEAQLALYQSEGSVIPPYYLKAFALLSGALDVNVSAKGEPLRYVTDGLDWRRAFGLYLWYNNKSGANLQEAIEQYVLATHNGTAAKPYPWYATMGSKQEPEHYDFLYQLMTLFVAPAKGLETVLHPLGMTPTSLDYRQSWLFYMVLCQSLHFSGFRSTSRHAKICEDFMFQLENLGLWEWAVFVALHLKTASSREAAVRQLLERNVDIPAPSSSLHSASVDLDRWVDESEKGSFVVKTLKVPDAWLWQARATRAKYAGNLWLEVFSLLKCGEYQKGHQLILTRLAPDCILHGDMQTLGGLLGMVDQSKVTEWDQGGGLYQKYLECCSDFEGRLGRLKLRSKVSYAQDLVPLKDIQALQDEAHALLAQLPTLHIYRTPESPLLEVCVSEMASKCTDLLRDLKDLSIQQGSSLADLPLTEDQRMDTLQKISSDYFDEILSFAETSAY